MARAHFVLLGLLALTPLVRTEFGWSDGVWVPTTQGLQLDTPRPSLHAQGRTQHLYNSGDSVQQITLENFCRTANAPMAWMLLVEAEPGMSLLSCALGPVVVAWMHIPGVHPTDPWYKGDVVAESPLTIATAEMDALSGQLRRMPDLIVLSSNFDDIARSSIDSVVRTHSNATLQLPFDAACMQAVDNRRTGIIE